MKDFVFITGNPHKAMYFSKWLGAPADHQPADLDELQSLDLKEVVEHKARQAYERVGRPVVVEDAALTFTAMGRLPGTFIKWFLEDLGTDGLVRLVDGLSHRQAVGNLLYAYYDGQQLRTFEGSMKGTIAKRPAGSGGFGFDTIFINDGYDITRAEMDEATHATTSYRAEAIGKLRTFLQV